MSKRKTDISESFMALEKLRDDDRVVQDRVGSQAMIFLECYDDAGQIVAGDRVESSCGRERTHRSG
jgi:hypothetical protein